jgi:hypothetical protein
VQWYRTERQRQEAAPGLSSVDSVSAPLPPPLHPFAFYCMVVPVCVFSILSLKNMNLTRFVSDSEESPQSYSNE